MNIKHLDTLVKPRSPKVDRVYNFILNAAYSMEQGDTLVDGDFKIRLVYAESRTFLFWNKDINFRLYGSDVKSAYRSDSTTLTDFCNYILNYNLMYHVDPWEIL